MKKGFDCANDASAMLQMFITTDKMHRALFERKIGSIGVHRSQHRVLMFLAKNRDTALSQKDIAEEFKISPAAVAVTLKRLEAEGYITRNVYKDDNRVNNVHITDKAMTIVNQTMEYASELERQIFRDFSPEELASFGECLEKMQRAMQDEKIHAQ